MDISIRMKAISPSLTLSITAKAKALKEEGVSIISFGAGEPDFNTPKYIIDAAKKVMESGAIKYTPSSGMLRLRQKIADKFLQEQGLSYKANQIIVSNGAKQSIFNTVAALINEGDEVIILAPYWLTYPEIITVCGGKPICIKGEEKNRFKVTPQQIAQACTSKTKMLILNSPVNPTGAVYTKEEIIAIAKILEDKNIYILSDEIYSKLIYNGQEHFSIACVNEKIKHKTIVVNGVSKTYAMTGWRIGWLAANEQIAKAIDSFQSHSTSNACTISQYAALAALEADNSSEVQQMIATFNSRRIFMLDKLAKIKDIQAIPADGAFYVMVNVAKVYGKKFNGVVLKNSIDFANALLDAGVAVIPAIAFGADECIRLSYAVSKEDIEEGLNRIEKFINMLQ